MRTSVVVRRTVAASILAALGLGCALPVMANPLQGATPLQGANPLQIAAPLQGAMSDNPTDGTAGQIDALNVRIAVLEAQLKIAKLQASIKKAKDGKPTASTGAASPESRATLPRVESISGAGSRLSAMVSLPDGGRRIVTPGSRLPGGLVVRSVTKNGVEVSGKRGTEWLSFLNGSASGDASSSQGVNQTPSPMFGSSAGSPFPLQGVNPMGANPPPMGMPGAGPAPGAGPMPDAAQEGE